MNARLATPNGCGYMVVLSDDHGTDLDRMTPHQAYMLALSLQDVAIAGMHLNEHEEIIKESLALTKR